MIKFYKIPDPYGWMSNFYKSDFSLYNRVWKTVEHAYQAQKTKNPQQYDEIHQADKARLARDLGQKVDIIPNWDEVKVSVMYDCVFAKFSQSDELKQLLLSTNDEDIVEDSPVDSFWGCGKDGNGRNELGKILAQVRSVLRK